MVSLTAISIRRDDEASDDDGPCVWDASNGGGAKEQEALQLSGVEEEGTGGGPAGDSEFSDNN